MLVEQDQPLSDEAPSGSSTAGEPRVFIVYRSRGLPWLLLPPLMILSAVAAIVVYRRTERPAPPSIPVVGSVVLPWSKVESERPHVAIAVSTPKAVEPKVPQPISAKVEPGPVQDPTVALNAPSVTSPSLPAEPFDPAPVVLDKNEPPVATVPASPPVMVGFDPAAAQVAHAPATLPPPDEPKTPAPAPTQTPAEQVSRPPPLLSADKPEPPTSLAPIPLVSAGPKPEAAQAERPRTEDVAAEINREAEKVGARRRELAAMQPESLRVDPRERQTQRDEIASVARRLEAEKREPFHAELRQILKDQGRNGGREIQALCDRFGKDYPPEIHYPAIRDLDGPAARLPLHLRVERMRRWGVPESVVLGEILDREERRINSPGGPRSRDEAWVFAARRLLTIPPPPVPPQPGDSVPAAR